MLTTEESKQFKLGDVEVSSFLSPYVILYLESEKTLVIDTNLGKIYSMDSPRFIKMGHRWILL